MAATKRINETGSHWDAFEKREVDIPVKDIEIDARVQRELISWKKVEHLVHNWNHLVVGRVLLSSRVDRSLRALDGLHRTLAFKEISDNEGLIPAEVYTGLTLEQEGQIFLDKNAGDKPTVIDRYRVGVVAGLHVPTEVDKLVHSFGWTVARSSHGEPSTGVLNCVVALQKLYEYSEENEKEPNLLLMALKMIDQIWGNDPVAGQAHFVTALGRVFGEYGDRIKPERLVQQLKKYKGGVKALNAAAKLTASTANKRLPMALAGLIVDQYNIGLGESNELHPWRRRT